MKYYPVLQGGLDLPECIIASKKAVKKSEIKRLHKQWREEVQASWKKSDEDFKVWFKENLIKLETHFIVPLVLEDRREKLFGWFGRAWFLALYPLKLKAFPEYLRERGYEVIEWDVGKEIIVR